MFDIMTQDAAKWAFPVEMQPVFNQDGQEIEGTSCIRRTDTGNVLGVHGSRYKLVSNEEIVSKVMDAVDDANLSRDYETKFYVTEGGRKLRGEVLFNDLTVQPDVGDYVKFRVSFFNSYDGSWSFQANAEGLRLWCLNGCTTPDAVTRTKLRHTQQISVEGTASKIALGLDAFMQSPDMWNHWRAHRIETGHAEQFFKKTLAKQYTRQANHAKTNERQLENLLSIWSNEVSQLGQNKWALYNAMTYWASHTESAKNPEVTRRNREDMVARAMQSKVWEEV